VVAAHGSNIGTELLGFLVDGVDRRLGPQSPPLPLAGTGRREIDTERLDIGTGYIYGKKPLHSPEREIGFIADEETHRAETVGVVGLGQPVGIVGDHEVGLASRFELDAVGTLVAKVADQAEVTDSIFGCGVRVEKTGEIVSPDRLGETCTWGEAEVLVLETFRGSEDNGSCTSHLGQEQRYQTFP